MTEANDAEKWREIRKAIVGGTLEDVLQLGCPRCGSSLRIIFMRGRRNSLNIDCSSCSEKIRADGVDVIPSWATEWQSILSTHPMGK
jgi:hypothetical protein